MQRMATGTFSDIHNPMSDINNMTYGTNTFRWIVSDGICVSADTVSVQSFEPVNANAGSDDKICQKMINGYLLKAVQPLVGTGYWSTSGIARVSDIYNPRTEVSSLGEGSNEFVWTVTNGVCSANDAVEIYLKSKVDCFENLD